MLCFGKRLFKNFNLRGVYGLAKYTKSTVLGIECTCDDTGVAVVTTERKILAESKRNQWSVHKQAGHAKANDPANMGGVVPSIAKQLHRQNLIYCVSECIESIENGWNSIDAIALAVQPGLEVCLWEGINFTKQLFEKYDKIFIPIHHMESHALTPRLFQNDLNFPYLSLLISGGHSMFVYVVDCERYIRLGETTDMALGLCIDRVARNLGLYNLDSNNNDNSSGGALVEKYAKLGDFNKYPKMINSMKRFCGIYKNCDFSFSGLYTAFHYLIKDLKEKDLLTRQAIYDICASLQFSVLVQLCDRFERAILFCKKEYNHSNQKMFDIVISGGVASNQYFYEMLKNIGLKHNARLIVPPIKYCTDNGVMIAWNGCEKILANSSLIVNSSKQSSTIKMKDYFKNVKPSPISQLGHSVSDKINSLNICLRKKQNKNKKKT